MFIINLKPKAYKLTTLTISSFSSKTELSELCFCFFTVVILKFLRERIMKAQKMLGIPCTAVFMLTLFLTLSQVSLGQGIPDSETQEEKRSEMFSRRALPKWLEVLPNSVPRWMKVEASKYRGSPQQIICAVKNMSKALNDMQAARARNCDDYFRCRGSHDAAQCGAYAASFVTRIR